MPPPRPDPLIGRRLGAYLVEAVLGAGGMGAVYRARHVETGVGYAIKVIRPEVAGADAVARFRREAEVLARLAHPGVVRVHAVGVEGDIPFCVMELVAGTSLGERLREGPLPPAEAAGLVAAVARAVEHAHAAGVLHRDIKPDNVVIDASGRPRLIDFGLAANAESDSRLTKTGATLGTPGFLAPEQVEVGTEGADAQGPATDVHGLGALLYAALTGRPPYEGSGASAIAAVLMRYPSAPSALVPGVPRPLDAICLSALRKTPAERPASAGELADLLEAWRRGEHVATRAPGRLETLRARMRIAPRSWRALVGVAAAALLFAATAAIGLGVATLTAERPMAVVLALADTVSLRPLTDAELARLDRIAADAPADDARLARRAELVATVARLAADHRRALDRSRLAGLVRVDGGLDARMVAIADEALARSERWDAVAAVLIGADPIAMGRDGSVRSVAAAVARGEIDAPTTMEGFDLLRSARALLPEERARLIGECARRLHEAERIDADALLALYRDALDEDRRFVAGYTPDSLHDAGLRAVVAEVRPEVAPERQTIALIHFLGRTPGSPRRLDPEHLAALQRLLWPVLQLDERARAVPTDRIALLGGLLMRYGAAPQALERDGALDADAALRLAERLLRDETDLAGALFLLELVGWFRVTSRRGSAQRERALTALALAHEAVGDRALGDDAPVWLRLRAAEVARHLARIGVADRPDLRAEVAWAEQRARARSILEGLLEQERRRALEDRWPLVPIRLARICTDSGDRAAAARAMIEATEVQLAVVSRIDELRRAGGYYPLELEIVTWLVLDLRDGALKLERPACCDPAESGGATFEALVAAARRVLDVDLLEAQLGFAAGMDARWFTGASFEGVEALHLHRHGRSAEALAMLDRFLEEMRRRRPPEEGLDEPTKMQWRSRINVWMRHRGEIDRARRGR